MKYTVEWAPPAEDELIALWMAAPDHGLVTAVVHQLEKRLELNTSRVVGSAMPPPTRQAANCSAARHSG
jgi:hypothetical protein